MITSLAHVTLLVRDYDEAVQWFTSKLGLDLRRDTPFGEGYRWVAVGVKGQSDVDVVLHKSPGGSESARSNVHGFVFFSDDCRRDTANLKGRGVKVVQGPEDVPWGVQTVFEDLYANTHVLLQPNELALGQKR